MKLIAATPERRVLSGIEVKSVTIPGERGEMTILPGHATLLSTLSIGVLKFELESGKTETAALSRGFLRIHNDEVIILADRLELAHEIDAERAKRALEKATQKLEAKEAFELDMTKWQEKETRARIRLVTVENLKNVELHAPGRSH